MGLLQDRGEDGLLHQVVLRAWPQMFNGVDSTLPALAGAVVAGHRRVCMSALATACSSIEQSFVHNACCGSTNFFLCLFFSARAGYALGAFVHKTAVTRTARVAFHCMRW